MPFQQSDPSASMPATTASFPRFVPSPTSLASKPTHSQPNSRATFGKARREQPTTSNSTGSAASVAEPAPRREQNQKTSQAPPDIASALIAYQRRQARSSDTRGRSRSSRKAANKDGADGSPSDEASRDKNETPTGGSAPRDNRKTGASAKGVSIIETAAVAPVEVKAVSTLSKGTTEPSGPNDPNAAAARRSRQSSEKGVLPEPRQQKRNRSDVTTTTHSPQVHSARGGGVSGRRERAARPLDARYGLLSQDFSSVSRDGRQLFDPRRHDPVKFASQQRTQPSGAGDDQSRAALPRGVRDGQMGAVASSLGESRIESFTASQATSSSLSPAQAGGPELSGSYTLQMHVAEIKQLYRRICVLEARLQQAHRNGTDKQRELTSTDAGQARSLNHDYWVTLAAEHRELAELHSSFLEMTLRPDMPENVQDLPSNYSLPSRLWQTAFHMMLERLRHSLPSAQRAKSASKCGSELLDHLTEFIYFAYAFYTTLFETEKFRPFRRAWIESLGDLARYRMAVAGLAASLSLDDDSGVRNKAERSTRKPAKTMRIDDDEEDANNAPPHDGASIGSDALGDWEFVEKETWRQTARDWYARGLAEMPNAGRLHHHLGILSRNEEVRALYHLCRSLTTSHPFVSAKETILSLFDHEQQSRRLQGDASIEDLFMYLHGALITRVQLDDFDEVFARLREIMDSKGLVICHRPLTETTWMLMASINCAGLLQYGAEGSFILRHLTQRSEKANDCKNSRTDKVKASTPTAIMVNPSAKAEDNHGSNGASTHSADGWEDRSDDLSDNDDEAALIQLDGKDDLADQSEEAPITLTYALRLAFFLLEFCLKQRMGDRKCEDDEELKPVSPYVTEFLTFIFSVIRFRPVYRLVERHMPWHALLDFIKTVPVEVIAKATKDSSTSYIQGKYPLPEDWCLRGTAGVGKQTYDRSLWKKSCASTSSSSLPVFRTEIEVLDSEDLELHEKFHNVTVGRGERLMSLDDLRMHRVVFISFRLAKTGRGLEFDQREQRFTICRALQAKLCKWKAEKEEQKFEAQLKALKLAKSLDTSSRNALMTQEEFFSASDTDDDADMAACEDEEVRKLRERKQYLKGLLRTTWEMMDNKVSSTQKRPAAAEFRRAKPPQTAIAAKKKAFSFQTVLPGYTVLLLDTNVLVTPGDLLKQLVESKRWTVVVPLAVITELDGLKRNTNALGEEAAKAIRFLETHIRSHSKYLKVQTSRGNYLCDLTIRSEDMNLGLEAPIKWRGEDTYTQKKSAQRNIDEIILRCLGWQTDHFVDRLALFAAHPAAARLKVEPTTAKAALLTLDRNLRVKAKARGLCGLDEQDITEVMIMTAEQSLHPPAPAAGGASSSATAQREVVS